MRKSLFLIFVVIGLLFVSSASASVDWDGTRLRINSNSDQYDMQTLYDDAVSTYGASTVNDSIFNETSPGVWHQRVFFYNADNDPLIINSSECSELRISGVKSGFCMQGAFEFDNVTVKNWNATTDTVDYSFDVYNYKTFDIRNEGSITNSKFYGFYQFRWGSESYPISDNREISNSIFRYFGTGVIGYTNNATIENVTVRDANPSTGWGFTDFHSSYSTFGNFSAINVSDHTSPSTGGYGIQVGGDYNNLNNIIVDGCAWSGTNLGGNNWIIDGITVTNTGHNGIEFFPNNSIIRNADVDYADYYSGDNQGNAFYVDGDGGTLTYGNITYENITCSHYTGAGLALFDGAHDINIDNASFNGYGLKLAGASNVTGIDVTASGGTYGLQSADGATNSPYKTDYLILIDSNLSGTSQGWYACSQTGAKIANTVFSSIIFGSGNYTTLYPLNVRVLNITNIPVSNATLTLNVTTFGLDGLGNYFVSVQTDSDGYPETPIYVPDYFRDSVTGYTYYNLNTVSAEKSGESDTSATFDPDDTWYSVNSSDPNGTLITLTLDVPGEGESIPLTINLFSPTDTTPATTNVTEQTFTVNFSKTVNSAGWYINGTLMEWDNSTLTASYSNSTAPVGVYNVTVIATDGVTEVNQTWIWTVSEDHDNEFVAVVFAGLSFVGLYFANRFRRR
jgi:hypothetical protein